MKTSSLYNLSTLRALRQQPDSLLYQRTKVYPSNLFRLRALPDSDFRLRGDHGQDDFYIEGDGYGRYFLVLIIGSVDRHSIVVVIEGSLDVRHIFPTNEFVW